MNVTSFQGYLELEMKKMEQFIVLNFEFVVNLRYTFLSYPRDILTTYIGTNQ